MRTLAIAFAATGVIAVISYIALREREPTWSVGGLYVIRDSEHGFGVVKILALDPDIVSVRIYKETFGERPSTIDPARLTLGTIHDAGRLGIGHLPLAESTFRSWEPQLLAQSTVSEEELEGYRMWKESGSGPFK